MKVIPILGLVICLAGAYFHYANQKPEEIPQPSLPPPKVEPDPPDLTRVSIVGRSSITNAKVKDVTRNGMLFECDQGLVQARFVDLDPEFKVYYTKYMKAPVQLSAGSPKTTIYSKSAEEAPKTLQESPQKRAVEVAARKKWLREQISDREKTMDQFSRQTSFGLKDAKNKGYNVREISSEQYELAKAELEEYKRQLADLQ